MRLTFVMLADLRVNRGIENVLFNLLQYKPENIEITIIEPEFNGNNPYILSENDVKERIGDSTIIHIKSLILEESPKSSRIAMIVRRGYNSIRPQIRAKIGIKHQVIQNIRDTDIVYLFHSKYAILFNNNIPVIGSEHVTTLDSILNNNIIDRLYHYIYYKHINGFHAFPKDKELLNKFKFKYKMVLPVGINTQLFKPDYDNVNSRLKVLFVGALVPEKGLDLLIPLINVIENTDIEFHIAGGGILANEIKNNKKIIFHEKPDDDTLAELYRECDIFVYPTHADTYGLVVLQALSSGLYILCSDYLKGVFDDFENKYLEYLPLDIDKFKDRIIEITQNKSLIKHDKEKEYNYVKDNYDWSVISKKFYDYMKKFYNESKNSD